MAWSRVERASRRTFSVASMSCGCGTRPWRVSLPGIQCSNFAHFRSQKESDLHPLYRLVPNRAESVSRMFQPSYVDADHPPPGFMRCVVYSVAGRINIGICALAAVRRRGLACVRIGLVPSRTGVPLHSYAQEALEFHADAGLPLPSLADVKATLRAFGRRLKISKGGTWNEKSKSVLRLRHQDGDSISPADAPQGASTVAALPPAPRKKIFAQHTPRPSPESNGCSTDTRYPAHFNQVMWTRTIRHQA
ncbi:hypothetical protein C8R47DRAFT_1135566 [Mycena vitilis]|nr:hypothetical protein C8R47DRAFT_1135566 [Mycena vitilis]